MGTLTEHAPNIDYKYEYLQARKMMTTKGADMDNVIHCIGLLLLNCPDDMVDAFTALLLEASTRQDILALLNS